MSATDRTVPSRSADIRILEPGDEPLVESFLLPRVDSSMFLVGNMRAAGLKDHGRRYEGTYAAVADGEQIRGLVAHYWNGNLVLQAKDQLVTLCRAAAEASGRPVKGVLGPSDQVETIKAAIGVAEHQVQMDDTEVLYGLSLDKLVVPPQLEAGLCRARRALKPDLELLVEWRVGFSIESLGERDSPRLWAQSRESIKRLTQDGLVWVLECDGRLASMSAFNAVLREAVQVGGVWTPPELRSRGYGRAAVAGSLLDARAEGVGKAILFTGAGNRPARRAYSALGFQIIGDYRILLLRSPPDWP